MWILISGFSSGQQKIGCGEEGGVHPMGLGILILTMYLVETTECALGQSSAPLGLCFCLSIVMDMSVEK